MEDATLKDLAFKFRSLRDVDRVDLWGQALLSCEIPCNQIPKNYSFQWKGLTPMSEASYAVAEKSN